MRTFFVLLITIFGISSCDKQEGFTNSGTYELVSASSNYTVVSNELIIEEYSSELVSASAFIEIEEDLSITFYGERIFQEIVVTAGITTASQVNFLDTLTGLNINNRVTLIAGLPASLSDDSLQVREVYKGRNYRAGSSIGVDSLHMNASGVARLVNPPNTSIIYSAEAFFRRL